VPTFGIPDVVFEESKMLIGDAVHAMPSKCEDSAVSVELIPTPSKGNP
jgi:hypothetical protein